MDGELVKLIGGSSLGAVILAALYGLSLLITAWRGGNASKETVERAEKNLKRLDWLEKLLPVVRYQRDQARLKVESYAERLGLPPPAWGEEPTEEE